MRRMRAVVLATLALKAMVLGVWCWGSIAHAERAARPDAKADGKPDPNAAPEAIVPGDLLARSRGFRDLLEAIRERGAELDEREQALQARAATLDALEKTVSAQLVRLDALTGGGAKPVSADAGAGTGAAAPMAAAALAGPTVTKIYENMKAEEAAPILDKLDDATAKTILGRMKEKQIGAILAAMNRDRAVALTKALAGS